MTVTFFKTEVDGPHQVLATVVLECGELLIEGNKRVADSLFSGVDRDDLIEVERVMREAPYRFDGFYVWATFEED